MSDLDRLAADLRKAGRVTRARTVQAIRKGAYDIAATGQALAPVDTGATRASIGVDYSAGAGEIRASIGPTTHYAPYLEFGTARMAPRPFMGPAADRNMPLIEQAIEQIGGDIL